MKQVMEKERRHTFVEWIGEWPKPGDYLYGPMHAPRSEPHNELILEVRPGRVNPFIIVSVRVSTVPAEAQVFEWRRMPYRRKRKVVL